MCPWMCVGVRFDKGSPFDAHLQLMGVLPPLSARLLPAPYRPLLTDPQSPIADFYPAEFVVEREERQAVCGSCARVCGRSVGFVVYPF